MLWEGTVGHKDIVNRHCLCACAKPRVLAIMYIRVFASFWDFPIEFRNCSNSAFHFITSVSFP
jgi:hypothetical protein